VVISFNVAVVSGRSSTRPKASFASLSISGARSRLSVAWLLPSAIDCRCIEHDKALARAATAVLEDDTELFKQFIDSEGFRRWLNGHGVALTYSSPHPTRDVFESRNRASDELTVL